MGLEVAGFEHLVEGGVHPEGGGRVLEHVGAVENIVRAVLPEEGAETPGHMHGHGWPHPLVGYRVDVREHHLADHLLSTQVAGSALLVLLQASHYRLHNLPFSAGHHVCVKHLMWKVCQQEGICAAVH